MDYTETVRRILLEAGFSAEGIIPTDELVFSEDIRKLCEQNRCRKYGTTWACPPAVGTLEECRERVLDFRYMHLFSKVYTLESSLDFRGMVDGMRDFKDSTWELGRKLSGDGSWNFNSRGTAYTAGFTVGANRDAHITYYGEIVDAYIIEE